MNTLLKIIRNEPSFFIQQLFPYILHQLNIKLSNYTKGYSFSIRRLLIVLTAKCDLSCRMCCLYGIYGLSKRGGKAPEFTTDRLKFPVLKKLIDEVCIFKPSIILTGGEPLLFKEFDKVTEYVNKKKLRIFLATGGSLLKEKKESIVNFVDHLQISLDGPSEEIHDKNRGKKGSFTKIIEGLRIIDDEKKRKNKKKPFINICFTITDINYDKIDETIEFVHTLGIDINEFVIQHLEFTNEEILTRHKEVYKEKFNIETNFWEGFLYQPRNINLGKLIEEVAKVNNKQYNIDVVFRPSLNKTELKEFYEDRYSLNNKKCLAPWQEVFILPDGSVWSCADYITGNIIEENFLKIWNNDKYRKLRILLNKIKYFPICKSCASFYVYK